MKREQNQAFLLACEYGDPATLHKLLQIPDLDINTTGLDRFTALHFAVDEGHMEIVNELLKAGADVECRSSFERTPLHLAAIRGWGLLMNLLNKALPNVTDFDGNTPLHYASQFGHRECIIYLLKERDADPLL